MMSRARAGLLLGCGVALGSMTPGALAQLRVANWNISFYNGSNRGPEIQTAVYSVFNGRSLAPDVFALQEFSSATALSTFVNVLNAAPGSPGDWAAAPFIPGPDSQSVLVYRTSRAQLLQALTIATGGANTNDQPRNTYRYDLRAAGYTSVEATFAVYSVHLKAGSASSDNARRLIETNNVRNNAAGMDTNGPGTALPAGYHYILSGDLNTQSATQSAYQRLVAAGGGGQFFDPIRRPGAWNGSSTYRFIHTQDPSGAGGMDDRHDQILLGDSLVDGQGMDYLGSLTQPWDLSRWDDPNHSYRCWGNDGTSFNTTLTVAGNTNVGPIIAQALKDVAGTAGGHLPVFLELMVPAKVAAPMVVDFGQVVQGSAAMQSISVGNGGDVSLWTAAGIAGLTYTLAPSSGFTAPAGTFMDSAGGVLNSHSISMSTATVGPKMGTITITAPGADIPMVVISLSGTVVAACGSADFNADGDVGTDADIEAFFACLGGACCPACGSADFDGDGDIGTDADIEAFFRVLAGGDC